MHEIKPTECPVAEDVARKLYTWATGVISPMPQDIVRWLGDAITAQRMRDEADAAERFSRWWDANGPGR